jgi:hypothetical protein
MNDGMDIYVMKRVSTAKIGVRFRQGNGVSLLHSAQTDYGD